MEWDDIIYGSLLLLSILFGGLYIRLPPGIIRQWTGSAVGVSTILIVSGYHVLHPLILCLVNILILQFVSKRWCHITSLVLSFSYLLMFRLSSYVGLPHPSGHANAAQMMMTLKLIGICYEVHDTWQLKKDINKCEDLLIAESHRVTEDHTDTKDDDGTELRKRTVASEDTKKDGKPAKREPSVAEQLEELQLRLKYEGVEPSTLDVLHYAWSYCGILTGPYYKYTVYRDSLVIEDMETWRWCLQRLRYLPLYAALFIGTSHFFPLKFAESTTIFRDYNMLYRILYMTPVFFAFRMRLYSGFVLGESVCIMAGLGAYPAVSQPRPGKGPTLYRELERYDASNKDSYNFEAVHNMDEYGSDFSPTVRGGMRCWNMSVQYWLVTNIYKRIAGPKPLKEAVTMLTSAFWHGMHSGYYLSMLTVPFILMVEDYYARLIRKRLSDSWLSTYDAVTWFLKMQWFSYMGMAFLLLHVDTTLKYWHSIGYVGHGLILVLYSFAQFINLIRGKVQIKLKRCKETAYGSDSKLMVKPIPEADRRPDDDTAPLPDKKKD